MKDSVFQPGHPWLDTEGQAIQAHGGGIMVHEGRYWWYGENKAAPSYKNERVTGWDCRRHDLVGVSAYSSDDLLNWRNEGIVLGPVSDDPDHDLHPSKVMERPKVNFNPRTGQFVMHFHVDRHDYSLAAVGVATSDRPAGPFRFRGTLRPNGADSRDLTVFVDDDGSAWLVHSSEWNRTLYISRLSEDWLFTTGEYYRVFAGQSREAPALFRHRGLYHLITSGCTGWDPNPAEHAFAEHLAGPWTLTGNPCRGPGAETTFGAQSTFVLPLPGQPDACLFMADIWNKDDLGSSRYVWLPLRFEGTSAVIDWRDDWTHDELR